MRLALFVMFLATAQLLAQDDISRPEEPLRDSRLKTRVVRYEKDAKEYEFFKSGLESSTASQLKLVDRPLMTYSDPSPGGQTHQGAFFIWTYLGRPEIVASIWSMGPDDGEHGIRHEFHSLSTESLLPKVVGGRQWAPATGIQMSTIPGAGVPSKVSRLRLGQMRTLAKEFTGFTLPPRANGREWRMRTAGNPIYRYESEDPNVLDGAVFVIFADWDPEMFLLIEARKLKGKTTWHFGQARLNSCPLRLEHKGKEVWKDGEVPFADPKANYFMVGGGQIPPLK